MFQLSMIICGLLMCQSINDVMAVRVRNQKWFPHNGTALLENPASVRESVVIYHGTDPYYICAFQKYGVDPQAGKEDSICGRAYYATVSDSDYARCFGMQVVSLNDHEKKDMRASEALQRIFPPSTRPSYNRADPTLCFDYEDEQFSEYRGQLESRKTLVVESRVPNFWSFPMDAYVVGVNPEYPTDPVGCWEGSGEQISLIKWSTFDEPFRQRNKGAKLSTLLGEACSLLEYKEVLRLAKAQDEGSVLQPPEKLCKEYVQAFEALRDWRTVLLHGTREIALRETFKKSNITAPAFYVANGLLGDLVPIENPGILC